MFISVAFFWHQDQPSEPMRGCRPDFYLSDVDNLCTTACEQSLIIKTNTKSRRNQEILWLKQNTFGVSEKWTEPEIRQRRLEAGIYYRFQTYGNVGADQIERL